MWLPARLPDEFGLNTQMQDIIAKKAIRLKGIVAIYAANSVGDDIEVYADEVRLLMSLPIPAQHPHTVCRLTTSSRCSVWFESASRYGMSKLSWRSQCHSATNV